MEPLRGALLLALVCLLCVPSTTLGCVTPNWDDRAGPNPFPEREGKVVLVALFKGYCGYCLHQANRLATLKGELSDEGYQDIDMLLINGGENRSRVHLDDLVNASPLDVIQDTTDHVLYQQVFGGYKDDFLVYDRCHQYSVYIGHPYSNLDRSITKRILKAVHDGRHHCYCSLDYAPRTNPEDVMQGDDPGGLFYQQHDMTRNMLHCNPDDEDCAVSQRMMNSNGAPRLGRGRGSRRREFRRWLREMRRQRGSSNPERRDYIADGAGSGRRRNGLALGGRGLGNGRRRGFSGSRRHGFARQPDIVENGARPHSHGSV